MSQRTLLCRLHCVDLEARETPTANLLEQSFEAVPVPSLPPGTSWMSNSASGFITSRLMAGEGQVSLASLGDHRTESRLWFRDAFPAGASVSLLMRSDNSTPMALMARAQNLQQSNPSYLAARLTTAGQQLEIVEVSGGVSRTLASVRINQLVTSQWYRVTLDPTGSRVTAQLQRLDTNQYLTNLGTWQASPTDALDTTTSLPNLPGQVGVWRSPGGTGMNYVDQLIVAPEPPQGYQTNFDTNFNPADWLRWTSDNTDGFQVSSHRSLSPSNGFSSNGRSNTASRAWLADNRLTDVQASVMAFADGLIPLTLFARGSNLNTAQPSYYGLVLVRGVEARLVSVINGVETTLATVRSRNWVSSTWLRMTLIAHGNELRGVISRADTGQFLTPEGTWQDAPWPSLTATHTQLPSGTGVGLARPAQFAGIVTVDDLDVRPAPSVSGPRVQVSASQPGSVFSGDVTFFVDGDEAAPPSRVEYRLNGRVRHSAVTTDSSWTLDTTTLENGAYTLIVWAVDQVGNASTTTLNFTTNNSNRDQPTRPELLRKFEHIRIAQLAYNGNPMSSFEQARLADSVDLVIPNPRYHQTIEAVAPTTPQLLYSNVSNLYQDLLTDWLSYADRTGASRELAFYHVSQATPFQGSSPAAQPVTWFWQATRTTANGTASEVTSAARSGTTAGINLGSVGETFSVGYPDKFREVNFSLHRGASGTWQTQLEYVSAVNADGTPRSWSPLPLLANTTNGLRNSGQVLFDPPRDWVASRTSPTGKFYFHVRWRTIAGTADIAAIVRTALGRDYVNAQGSQQGVIPAFDFTADRDGDGYLNDAEFRQRAVGKEARFAYESRLFYPFYGQMRFATNPASTAVRRWAADYHSRLLAEHPLTDGLFLDNSNGRLPISGISVIEPTGGYSEDYAGMVRAVVQAVSPKLVFTNTAGGQADAVPIAAASTGVLEEFLLRPSEVNWSNVQDIANLVQSRLNADSPSPYVILDSHPGSLALSDPRLRSATLAYYYLLADPDRTMLMMYGGFSPSGAWSQSWIPAVARNVGQPTAELQVFARGQDPENAALAYQVFSRSYENALVLYKPRSYTLGQGTGSLNAGTATTHQLGAQYRVLNPDNSLGPIITQITLRNGEGVVLMKV